MKKFKNAVDRQNDPVFRELMPISEIAAKIEA
jgi:hypothetical protein